MVLQESAQGNWVTTSAPHLQGAPLHGTWSQETGSARLKVSTHEEGCTRRRTASLAALRLPHSPGLGALTAGHAHIIQASEAPHPRDSIRADRCSCCRPSFLFSHGIYIPGSSPYNAECKPSPQRSPRILRRINKQNSKKTV